MQFIFFNQAGKPVFVRDDAEQASWSVDEMALNAVFPYDRQKVVERGMRVGFEDEINILQPFEVRKVEIIEPDHYQRITCEHIAISELTDCHMEAQELNNVTAQAALAGILTGTGWSIGTVTSSGTSSGNLNIGSVWQNVRAIEENWNVFITPRVTFNTAGITGKYLDIAPANGTWRGILLTLDRNANDLGVTIDDTDVKTALYGYGASADGIPLKFGSVAWTTTSEHPAKPLGQTYIEDPAATAAYGRNGAKRFGFYQNSDITDPNILLQKTWETLQTTNAPKVTVNCTVKDLYRLGYNDQPIRLHDKARVVIKDTNTRLELDIVRLSVDLLNPTMTRPTIGAYIPNIVYIQRQTAQYATGGAASTTSGRRGGGGGGRSALQNELEEFETQIVANKYEIGLRAFQRDLSDTDGRLLKAYAAIGISSDNIEQIVTGSGVVLDDDGHIITDENGNPIFVPGANPMYTKLNQTAEEVSSVAAKSGVNSLGQGETLYSKISQTAEAITSEVTRATNAESSMSSRITQTASEISSEVTNRQNADNQLSSRITQNANSISLVVSDGGIKAASIVTAINNAGSSVTISADKVDINGYLRAHTVQVDGLSSTKNIASQGWVIAGSYVNAGSDVQIGGNSLKAAIVSFGTATESGGQITIPTTTVVNTQGPPINFNIADTQFYKNAAVSTVSVSLTGTPGENSGHYYQGGTASLRTIGGSTISKNVSGIIVDSAVDYGRSLMGVRVSGATVQRYQTSKTSVTISTDASVHYNSTTHKYTAMSLAYADGVAMTGTEDTSAPSGTEAYEAGVTKGHSDRNIKASAFTVGNITDYPSVGRVTFNITATADDGTTYTSAYQSISYSGSSSPSVSRAYITSFSVSSVSRYGDGYEVMASAYVKVEYSDSTSETFGPYTLRDIA